MEWWHWIAGIVALGVVAHIVVALKAIWDARHARDTLWLCRDDVGYRVATHEPEWSERYNYWQLPTGRHWLYIGTSEHVSTAMVGNILDPGEAVEITCQIRTVGRIKRRK